MLAKPRCDPAAVLKQGRETVANTPTVRKPVRRAVRWCTFPGMCPTRRVLRVSSKHYGVNREELGSSRPIIMSKTNPLDTREFRLGSVLWKKG